jgi:hypothetical protein
MVYSVRIHVSVKWGNTFKQLNLPLRRKYPQDSAQQGLVMIMKYTRDVY